ncbi:hypothetical protein L7F22_053531 [Adiantum nelumboides]|nr:hypothetical protein [Adiantum nelumboides]
MPFGRSTLISCTSLKDAVAGFNKLQERDVFLWSDIIGLHAKYGRCTQAIQLFQQMQQESIIPNDDTLLHMVTTHTKQDFLCAAKQLHACLFEDTIQSNLALGSSLVTMYGRQGRVDLAESLFSHIKQGGIALWNAMIDAYAQNEQNNHVLQMFYKMQATELVPNTVTYACVLRACSRLLCLEDGRLIHIMVVCVEVDRSSAVGTTLISMYGKCGSLDDAQSLFTELVEREVITWNSMIAVLVGHDKGMQAHTFFCQMHQEAVFPDRATFVSILGAFSTEVVLREGKRIHAYIAACGFLCDKVVTTALLDMYGSCGSMNDAENLFDGMVERGRVSWNAMLSELVQNKRGERAFVFYERMLWEGQVPNKVTYLNMLFACTLENTCIRGAIIHLQILINGYELNVAVATAVLSMYGNVGNLELARRVFDIMHERNIVAWNSMLKAYAESGLFKNVFHLFNQLKQEGLVPNNSIAISSLSACSSTTDLAMGKQIHVGVGDLPEQEPDLLNALINMYTRCDSLHDALKVSERMLRKDVSCWNSLIEAFAHKGDTDMSFQLLFQSWHEGILPNKVTFINALQACNSSGDLPRCLKLHVGIAEGDLKQDVTIASALIKAYSSCGDIKQGHTVFSTASVRDIVLWNSMLSLYSHQGFCTLSLQLYAEMHQEGQLPISVSFVSLFSACSHSKSLLEGKRLHALIAYTGLECDIPLLNSLIYMYGRCSQHEVSERLFFDMPQRSRVSWSCMIAMHAELEHSQKALQLFYQMVNQEDVLPDKITVLCALSACACSLLLVEGRELHTLIVSIGFEADTEVANSLTNMYGKCGDLEDAWDLFLTQSTKSTCSWNTMLGLLLYHGHNLNAVHHFKQMQKAGVLPCEFTYASMLFACCNLASLFTGRLVHFSITCDQEESTTMIDNSIISMYGKCGSLEDASWHFNRLSARNVVSWNSMLASYAQHGCGEKALIFLNVMDQAASPPDQVSFLTAVSACSRTGLVDTGFNLWISMCHDLKISPSAKHFACLVDVFGRAGCLSEAQQLITNMPTQPCLASWAALLSACRDHTFDDKAAEIALYLFEMDSEVSSTYVMHSNIHVPLYTANSLFH